MSPDALTHRVLAELYAEWFRYDSLQPERFWIAGFPPVEPDTDGWFLDTNQIPSFVLMAEKIGLTEKSICDWQRFYSLHTLQPWNAAELALKPYCLPPQKHVYETGLCYFSQDALGRLALVISLGPLYGRGYLFGADGTVLEAWKS